MIGQTISHFRFVEKLGQGGMGEVYRAKDLTLGRDVAIKVLPDEFARDPDRIARFQREAKLLASLNHPNIAAVYGLEESGGTSFLVLELIEGETLADHLKRGPIAAEECFRIALQIAEALEAAHEKGVIHRDLKPANIKVTPEGKVKVLDFGLAKALATEPTDLNLSNSPTLSMAATQQGVILGTAAYMSPEQARGKVVDKRTDIWAFGVVLYEMLTGRQLFSGEDITEILAAVVKDQPDWSKAPAHARRLLESCLEKDSRKRLRDIGDIRYLLDANPVPSTASSGNTARLGWTAAAVFSLLAIAAAIGWLRSRPGTTEMPSTVFTIIPPSGRILDQIGGAFSAPQISPDGSAVMFFVRDANGRCLFVRPVNSLYAQRVPGSEGISNPPFWSADSTSVVYPAGDQLIKVAMPDGAPQSVAKLPGASRGGSWSDKGAILFSRAAGLSTVPCSGGDFAPVDVSALGTGTYLYPEFLPGGEDFLLLYKNTGPLVYQDGDADIYLATLRDKKLINPALLLKNATAAHFTAAGGGRVLFVRDDNLYSQKLNRSTRTLEGEANLAVKGVGSHPGQHADFSVARNGTVVWRPGRAALSQVTIFDRHGNQIGTAGPPGPISSLRLSPDEKQLLADRWLFDENQQGRLALPAGVVWLGWSTDGLKLLGFRSPDQFVEMSAAGSGGIRQLQGSGRATRRLIGQDISPDGKWLLGIPSGGKSSILAENMRETAAEPMVLVQTGEMFGNPRFSPDGRWIVYYAKDIQSQSSGLYVQPFPGPGQRRQIAAGGYLPEWRKDGKEILYSTSEGDIVSIPVKPEGNSLRFGTPQKLFSGGRIIGTGTASRVMAVSRDGSRIYLPQAVEQPDSNMIHIKMGWLK